MIRLKILNETGHTSVTLSADSIIEQIDNHPTHWSFIDGEMVSRENIATINWIVTGKQVLLLAMLLLLAIST